VPPFQFVSTTKVMRSFAVLIAAAVLAALTHAQASGSGTVTTSSNVLPLTMELVIGGRNETRNRAPINGTASTAITPHIARLARDPLTGNLVGNDYARKTFYLIDPATGAVELIAMPSNAQFVRDFALVAIPQGKSDVPLTTFFMLTNGNALYNATLNMTDSPPSLSRFNLMVLSFPAAALEAKDEKLFALLAAGSEPAVSVSHVDTFDSGPGTFATSSFMGRDLNATGYTAMALARAQAADTVYVFDYARSVVEKLVGDAVSHVAGSRLFGLTDGAADVAAFGRMSAMAVDDSTGHLYLFDDFQAQLRRVYATTGDVQTVPIEFGFSSPLNNWSPGPMLFAPTGGATKLFMFDFHAQATFRFGVPAFAAPTTAAKDAFAVAVVPELRRLFTVGSMNTASTVNGYRDAARISSPTCFHRAPGARSFYFCEFSYNLRAFSPLGAVTTIRTFPTSFPVYQTLLGAATDDTFREEAVVWVSRRQYVSGAPSANYGYYVARSTKISTTNFAGNVSGYADGVGDAARFEVSSRIGLAFANGYLYAADKHRIRRINTTTANVSTVVNGFAEVYAIAADRHGYLFTADYTAAVVYKVSPTAVVSRIAGSGWRRDNTDGTGDAASFYYMSGLDVADDGVVYVADTNGHIRRIGTDHAVTTWYLPVGTLISSVQYICAANGRLTVAVDNTAWHVFLPPAMTPAPTVAGDTLTSAPEAPAKGFFAQTADAVEPSGTTAPVMLTDVVMTVGRGWSGDAHREDGAKDAAQFGNLGRVTLNPKTGELVVIDGNGIRLVDPLTGATSTLYHNDTDSPVRAVAVTARGDYYFTSGRTLSRIYFNATNGAEKLPVREMRAYPSGLCLSPDDSTLYFVEDYNRVIAHTISSGGAAQVTPSADMQYLVFDTLQDVVLINAGTSLLVYDYAKRIIFKVGIASATVTVFARVAPGLLTLHADAAGYVYVVRADNVIDRYTAAGEKTTIAIGAQPEGVVVVGEHMYVAWGGTNQLQKLAKPSYAPPGTGAEEEVDAMSSGTTAAVAIVVGGIAAAGMATVAAVLVSRAPMPKPGGTEPI
jgi:sugar lactone lactonase YvrE